MRCADAPTTVPEERPGTVGPLPRLSPSFPRSAWECVPRRSASMGSLYGGASPESLSTYLLRTVRACALPSTRPRPPPVCVVAAATRRPRTGRSRRDSRTSDEDGGQGRLRLRRVRGLQSIPPFVGMADVHTTRQRVEVPIWKLRTSIVGAAPLPIRVYRCAPVCVPACACPHADRSAQADPWFSRFRSGPCRTRPAPLDRSPAPRPRGAAGPRRGWSDRD